MKCERCDGLIIAVSFVAGDDAGRVWEYDGLKCVNCGHITDPLLKKNRERLPQNDVPYYSGSSQVMNARLGTVHAA